MKRDRTFCKRYYRRDCYITVHHLLEILFRKHRKLVHISLLHYYPSQILTLSNNSWEM
jgi:hypothetical protein